MKILTQLAYRCKISPNKDFCGIDKFFLNSHGTVNGQKLSRYS